jgi:dTDP-D-glucose 4,6-dehydratase
MTLLVTGGAGFIGGNFVLDWLADAAAEPVVNLDKLTYAGATPKRWPACRLIRAISLCKATLVTMPW